jgi:hypothetical protein
MMMRKKMLIVHVVVGVSVAIFAALEPPLRDYVGLVFSDSFEPRFRFASMGSFKNMRQGQRDSIFVAFLGGADSLVVSTCLVENTGLMDRPMGRKVQLDSSTIHVVSSQWKAGNRTCEFVTAYSGGLGRYTLMQLSPIKRIGTSLYLGIERSRDSDGKSGCIYRIRNEAGRYIFEIVAGPWMS